MTAGCSLCPHLQAKQPPGSWTTLTPLVGVPGGERSPLAGDAKGRPPLCPAKRVFPVAGAKSIQFAGRGTGLSCFFDGGLFPPPPPTGETAPRLYGLPSRRCRGSRGRAMPPGRGMQRGCPPLARPSHRPNHRTAGCLDRVPITKDGAAVHEVGQLSGQPEVLQSAAWPVRMVWGLAVAVSR